MRSKAHIIESGGWTQRQYMGKPKARLFSFMAGAWLAVTFFASLLFWNGFPGASTEWSWLYALLIVPEPIFVGLAVVFWITEEPRMITEWRQRGDASDQWHWIWWP